MNAKPIGPMGPDVKRDWTWAAAIEENAKPIMQQAILNGFTHVKDSSQREDLEQGIDYVFGGQRITIGARCRRIETTGTNRDVTIRWRRPTGARTERDKWRRGIFPDVYFFGWVSDQDDLDEYLVMNVRQFIASRLFDCPAGFNKTRGDGVLFAFWPWQLLQDHGCIVEGVKYPGRPVSFHIVTTHQENRPRAPHGRNRTDNSRHGRPAN